MSITIDLSPAVEHRVREQATLQGVPIEEYVHSLIIQATSGGPSFNEPFSREQFEKDWDEFSAGTEHLPVLSDADLSREAMYADHD